MDDKPLAEVATRQWGAIRSLLKHIKGEQEPCMSEEEVEETKRLIEKHVQSAADTIPPHLEAQMGRVIRQMRSTTLYEEDDEPTLVPLEPFVTPKPSHG